MNKDTISDKVFEILQRNLEKLSFTQKEKIRNTINSQILKEIEKESRQLYLIDPSAFTQRQFGM